MTGRSFDLSRVVVNTSLPLPQVLRSVERQIAAAEVEVAFVFRGDGHLLDARVGEASAVGYAAADLAVFHDAYLTHNHPNQSYLSHQDVWFAHQTNLAEIRAVAGNWVHVLRRPASGWDRAAYEHAYRTGLAAIIAKCYRFTPTGQPYLVDPATLAKRYATFGRWLIRTLSLTVQTHKL